MLALTADIAEELLLIKDAERDTLPDGLKLKIISLAELAATVDAPESTDVSGEGEISMPPEADSVTPEAEITESQEEEACQHEEPAEEAEEEAESAEFEEEADACPMDEVLPAKEEAVDDSDEIEEKKIVESEPATDIDDEKVCEVSGEVNSDDSDDSDDSGDVADSGISDGLPETYDASGTEEAVEPEISEQPEQSRRRVTPDDLYRAFSINDAFFFRREIFGGSRQQMMEALVRISMLPDKKALQEYLVERLALDIDETPGKEFYQSLAALL